MIAWIDPIIGPMKFGEIDFKLFPSVLPARSILGIFLEFGTVPGHVLSVRDCPFPLEVK